MKYTGTLSIDGVTKSKTYNVDSKGYFIDDYGIKRSASRYLLSDAESKAEMLYPYPKKHGDAFTYELEKMKAKLQREAYIKGRNESIG